MSQERMVKRWEAAWRVSFKHDALKTSPIHQDVADPFSSNELNLVLFQIAGLQLLKTQFQVHEMEDGDASRKNK